MSDATVIIALETTLPGHPLTPALPSDPQRVLLTGATGFVGQALLERLLRTGQAHVWVLVRPRGPRTGADRVRALLRKSVFAAWENEIGAEALAEVVRSRVTVLEGDLRDVPALPADLDLVLHSASSVTFDEPADRAFRTNVGGPAALYRALAAAGGDPHVVHVSTAYVWTGRTDVGRERPVDHDLDWRAELTDVLRERDRVVASHGEHEVDTRMRVAGRERARRHGWTDVYTMTKALGERVAEQEWAGRGHRLTIVRPTIIESALSTPFPGWIDGFKVADPLIAAYARGHLTGFPGRAEAVLDIVPVDQVVATILAAAVSAPDARACRYLQVGSSTSNPLSLAELRRHVQGYFSAQPWVRRDGVVVRATPWEFGDPGTITRRLHRGLGVVGGAAGALRRVRIPARRSLERLDTLQHRLETMNHLVEIYAPYTCASTVYDDTNTRALHADGADWRVGDIDWSTYLRGSHLPAVVGLMRGRPPRPAARRRAPRPVKRVGSGAQALEGDEREVAPLAAERARRGRGVAAPRATA